MINTKRFFTTAAHSSTMTVAVQRVIDGYYLQSADGSFGSAFSSLAMTETMTCGYSLDENRAAWNNGIYDVVFYKSAVSVGGYETSIVQDQLMEMIPLVALAAKTAVSQIAGALGLINSSIADLTKNVSLLQGQVNDVQFQSRRSNGNV